MKRSKTKIKQSVASNVLPWLPIDSRLLPDIFSFSHVHGIARVFLELEIILATAVVLGTFVATVLYFFG